MKFALYFINLMPKEKENKLTKNNGSQMENN